MSSNGFVNNEIGFAFEACVRAKLCGRVSLSQPASSQPASSQRASSNHPWSFQSTPSHVGCNVYSTFFSNLIRIPCPFSHFLPQHINIEQILLNLWQLKQVSMPCCSGVDELRSVPNNVECVSLTQQVYLKVLNDSHW